MKRKLLSIILIIFLILPSAEVSADAISSISDALAAYKGLITRDTLDWVADMYDGVSGGFYFSQSAKENPDKYAPTIECINWAKDGLRGCGIVTGQSASIPDVIRKKFTAFIKDRQGDDNFFYDYYAPENRLYTEASDLKKGRDLAAAKSVLEICGSLSEVILPDASPATMSLMSGDLASKSITDIQSEQEFLNWLSVKHPFTQNPYQDGSTLAANRSYIVSRGWESAMISYLVEKQSADGLWGDAREEEWAKNNRINAALKNCAWFQKGGTAYPKFSEALESVLYAFENYEMPASLCESWNRLELIRCARMSQESISTEAQNKIDQNLLSMLKACLLEIKNFKMADGGYSMYKGGGTGLSMDFPVCEAGKAESDMNAFAVIRDYIRTAHFLAGAGEPTFEDNGDAEYFWSKILLKATDYRKTQFYQNDKEVFDISTGKFSAISTVCTTSGYENNIRMFVGVYDSGKLLDVKVTSKTVQGGKMEEILAEDINMPSTAGKNAYVKVMIWKVLEPFGKSEYIYLNGSADLISFTADDRRCDINTEKSVIYVECDNEVLPESKVAAEVSNAGSYSILRSCEGFVSNGDKCIVKPVNAYAPQKEYTIIFEKLPQKTFISTFDGGYSSETNPAINPEGDGGEFDLSSLSFVSIKNEDGNNVLQIDKTESGGQCNIHRYYHVDDADKYAIEYKFKLLSSNGDYLFHNNLFGGGISPKSSTWNNSTYDKYKDYYVDDGYLLISHTAFLNSNKLALLKLGEWNKIKVVMRKTANDAADYEVYINDTFVYSCGGTLEFEAGEKVKMILIEDLASATYKIQYDDFKFSY